MSISQVKEILHGIVKTVKISEVKPDPNQPRQEFDEDRMANLKKSISERGILVPITVEPKQGKFYPIIDGERRFRSALALGIKQVPINILRRKLNDTEKNVIRFHLQETHTQWSIFEKAEAMANLKETLNIDSVTLARALGLSVKTCGDYLSLLSFPGKIKSLAIKERMPYSYVRHMVWMNNVFPSEFKKSVPDFLERTIEKYKSGYVSGSKDLRCIMKLVKNGEVELGKKYFTDLKYTASMAMSDSEFVDDQRVESITNRARHLLRDVRIIYKNKIEIGEISEVVLKNLIKELDKIV